MFKFIVRRRLCEVYSKGFINRKKLHEAESDNDLLPDNNATREISEIGSSFSRE